MRKTLTALSIAAALFAGQAMADKATVDSLEASGIPVTAEQTATIAEAEGQALVNALADLIASQPHMAAAIVTAAIKANPGLTDAIEAAAIAAAPEYEQAIRNAVITGLLKEDMNDASLIPSSSLPSVDGSGNGRDSSLASPN